MQALSCVEPAPALELAGPGTRISMARMRVSVCETCDRPRGRQGLRIGSLSVLNGLHLLSAGAVGFARGLNDTPKIAGLLALGSLAGAPSIALVAGAMASCGALFGIGAVTGGARWRTIGGIFAAWVVTLPLAAALAALAALLLGSR